MNFFSLCYIYNMIINSNIICVLKAHIQIQFNIWKNYLSINMVRIIVYIKDML